MKFLYSFIFKYANISLATEIEGDAEPLPVPVGAQIADDGPEVLPDIDFDNGTYITRHNLYEYDSHEHR